MESDKKYCGSGKQIFPDMIELVINIDEIPARAIKTSKAGKRYAVLNLNSRKKPGAYGETHSISVKHENSNG